MTDKQKITEILKAYTKKNNISASSVILEEYVEELLANGVIVPPCKVGDMVYEINTENPFEEDLRVMETKVERFFVGTSIDIHSMDCIGKTVFLTKEDAEEKLKELGK